MYCYLVRLLTRRTGGEIVVDAKLSECAREYAATSKASEGVFFYLHHYHCHCHCQSIKIATTSTLNSTIYKSIVMTVPS